jgi:hypothetical protein
MPDTVEASDRNISDFEDMEDFKLEAISRRSEKLNNRAKRRTRNRSNSRKYREIQTKKVNLDEFCQNGTNIYTTHPTFLLTSDQPVANSEFSIGADKYKLPAKNRLDLDLRQPSNPGYLWYSVFGVMLSSTGVVLYGASSKKYLELFPKMFEQYKTFTLESQLIETEKREEIQLDTLENMTLNRQATQQNIAIQTHATTEKTAYVQEQITKQYQGYRALDYSDAEIEQIQEQAKKQEHLQELSFELQIAELAKQISALQLETVKDNKEIKKIENSTDTENKKLKPAKDGRIVQELPNIAGIEWWDWNWLKDKSSDDICHIRLVAPTGCGKTTLADWMLNIMEGENKIITIKRKPHQWKGRNVIGVPENFDAVADELMNMAVDRKTRLQDVADGKEPSLVNFVIDEWRAINQKLEFAQEIIRDTLCLSREAKQRLLLMAQGKQVKTFGLKDESDLEECLTSLFMGKFAIEQAQAYYNNSKHLTEEAVNQIMKILEDAGKRALFVESSFGVFPGIVPDLM